MDLSAKALRTIMVNHDQTVLAVLSGSALFASILLSITIMKFQNSIYLVFVVEQAGLSLTSSRIKK